MTKLTAYLDEKLKICSSITRGQVEFHNRIDADTYYEAKITMPKLIAALRVAIETLEPVAAPAYYERQGGLSSFPRQMLEQDIEVLTGDARAALKQISEILGVDE